MVCLNADVVAAYDALMASQKKEVYIFTQNVETKLKRIGGLGVEFVYMTSSAG